MAFHDGNMNGVSGREQGRTLSDLARPKDVPLFDCKDFIDHIQDHPKCRLDSVSSLNSRVSMQDFLQDHGICYEAFASGDQTLQQDLGIGFVRMGSSDQVHRNIRVDEDQAS